MCPPGAYPGGNLVRALVLICRKFDTSCAHFATSLQTGLLARRALGRGVGLAGKASEKSRCKRTPETGWTSQAGAACLVPRHRKNSSLVNTCDPSSDPFPRGTRECPAAGRSNSARGVAGGVFRAAATQTTKKVGRERRTAATVMSTVARCRNPRSQVDPKLARRPLPDQTRPRLPGVRAGQSKSASTTPSSRSSGKRQGS